MVPRRSSSSSLLLLMFFLFPVVAFAQTFRDSVDVLHYAIRLEFPDPAVPGIRGHTTINLITKFDNTLVKLDLLELTVDSVITGHQKLRYSHDGKVLSVHHIVKSGDTLAISVYYHGIPVQDKRWGGFYFTQGEAFNYGVGMDAQPPAFGRCWFPCIDSFTDRALYDFSITVPDRYTAVCNGIHTRTDTLQDLRRTWHWTLDETIPTYLASLAVGRYDSIHYSILSGGHYLPVSIYDRAENLANARNSFQNLPKWMNVFTEKFGDYRWDRVGFVMVPFRGGAMEHAANIAISRVTVQGDLTRETLYAHELSHSWFGDLVTCSSEADMWLNEGWASYAESIMLEGVYGEERFLTSILNNQLDVLLHTHQVDGGYFPVYHLPHELTYGSTIYDKGALVVHNLRQYLGDSVFFTAVRKYLRTYSFSNCSVPAFQKFLQTTTGTDLQDFFNFWVYGKGFNDIQTDLVKTEAKDQLYTSYIRLHQALLATEIPQQKVKTSVAIHGRNALQKKIIISFSGADTVITVNTEFQPLALESDPDYLMLNACVHKTFSICQKSDTINTPCLFSCMYSGQKGPGLLMAELHLTAPQASQWPLNSMPDSSRYWKISSIDFHPQKLGAVFALDPSSVIEDRSLFYRKNLTAAWKIIPARVVKTAGSMEYLYTEKLEPGYYATGSMRKY